MAYPSRQKRRRPPAKDPDYARRRYNEMASRHGGQHRVRSPQVNQRQRDRRTKYRQAGAGRRAISTYLREGGGKGVSAATRRRSREYQGLSENPSEAANQVFSSIYTKLSNDLATQALPELPVDEYNQQVNDENAMRTAYAAQVLDQQVNPADPRNSVDPEQFAAMREKYPDMESEDIIDFIKPQPSIDEQYLGSKLNKYGLEPLSRPLSAIAEGFKTAMEREDPNANTGQQFLEAFPNFGGGFVKGMAGEAKGTGMGNVYEYWQKNSEMFPAQKLRELEESHPWVESAISKGVGLAGDITLDPVGKFVGGAKQAYIGGERATAASARRFSESMGRRWASETENLISGGRQAAGGYRYHPTEQAIGDSWIQEVNNYVDSAELSIHGGASKGTYTIHGPKQAAGHVGAVGAQSLLDSLTVTLRDKVQKLVDHATGKNRVNGTSLRYWESIHPDFTDVLDDITDTLVQKNQIPPGASRDVLANYLSTGSEGLIRDAYDKIVDNRYSTFVTSAADDIAREFRQGYYHSPAIRLSAGGYSKTFSVKAVGKAYAALQLNYFDNVGKNFRYNSVFPGSLALETTRNRAFGIKSTEDFEKELREYGNQFPHAQAVEIGSAIENNTIHLLPPDMQQAANWVTDQNRWLHDDEFLFGARGRKRGSAPGVDSSTTPYDPNYVYVYNRGGEQGARKRFKDKRKAEIHKNVRAGKGGAGRFKTANAKAEHLRPRENVFEALRERRIKYNRDMARARFRADMIDKYGIRTRLSKSGSDFAMESRRLHRVDFESLPEHLRVSLEQTGEDIFLPREMADMLNIYDELTKWNSGMQGRVGRSFARVMRIIKKGMTLPWVGFHNKNMIGDVFMGLLDGIYPQDYARVIAKGTEAAAGGSGTFRILKQSRDLDLPFREGWGMYQEDANSGFVTTELAGVVSPRKYNVPRRVLGRTERIVQGISGFREDSGRFTHYITAYTEEAQALWDQGMRDPIKIKEKARSAALWRVNNYKFDYNALMLWEKKTKTMAFPFYTFMRKAAPTLVQAIYQDPRWISAWTRFLYQRSEGEQRAGEFDGFRVPEDIRDIGYAFLGGQKDQPTYVTNDILPTSVFNSIRFDSPKEFFSSMLSQTALPYQVAVEAGTGRSTFLDKPIDEQDIGTWGGFAGYLGSKLPGSREFDQFFDSDASWKDKVLHGELFDPDKSWGERLLTSRIGAGLPIRKLRENQQLYAENEWFDRMIDKPLQDINYNQDIYFISRQGTPTNFVVTYKANDSEVGRFYTPEEAIQYVKAHLPDSYKKMPMTYDIDNQGKPTYRPVND